MCTPDPLGGQCSASATADETAACFIGRTYALKCWSVLRTYSIVTLTISRYHAYRLRNRLPI